MKNFTKLSLKAKTIIICILILLTGAAYFYATGQLAALTASKDTTCQMAVTGWEKENPQMTTPRELFTGVPAPVDFATTPFTKAKDFKKADKLRNTVQNLGYVLEDTPEGTKVKQWL